VVEGGGAIDSNRRTGVDWGRGDVAKVKRITPLVGATLGLVAGLLLVALWASPDRHTLVLLLQTIFLAAAFVAAVYYTQAALRTAADTAMLADTARKTAKVELLSRSVLFVTDPIKTVGEYKKKEECSDLDKLVRRDASPISDGWLMIEITNEGDKKAMNIKAWAKWNKSGFDDVDATPSDRMQPLCKFAKFDGEEKNGWREWRLPPDQ